MALIEIKWHPPRKELFHFGIIALVASGLLAGLLYFYKDLALTWSLIIIAFGLFTFLTGLFAPALTRLIYLALILITLPIGLILSFCLMAVFYFLIITPLGLVFRIMGRDPLCRRFDPNAPSYWIPHSDPEQPDRYFRQF